ncbi:MAG: alpha/beta hydrolase [Acidobacteria bacterium]|nr:alpha/beta hydrolase [Acidobacteriota bacterium]
MRRLLPLLFLLLPLISLGQAVNQVPKVEKGRINGADFRIELPPGELRGLVMYCHGYQLSTLPYGFDSTRAGLLRQVFLARGFAIAESTYSRQGWAVKEAVEDTEALRRHFFQTFGPFKDFKETIVLGHSMGGVIALATIEKYPEIYDGALPMCGPLNPSINGLQERVFDLLATFDFHFPGIVGPLTSVPSGARLDVTKIKAAVAAAPERSLRFARRYSLASADELAGVLTFFYEINREIQERAGGNPFDNQDTIYDGFEDDLALNRGISRYAATAKAQEYLRQHYSPTGRIHDPVLTLHTIYDQLIPGRFVSQYEEIARLAGTQELFVTKYVDMRGHCNFTPDQTGAAFDQLLKWIREKVRPVPGELK